MGQKLANQIMILACLKESLGRNSLCEFNLLSRERAGRRGQGEDTDAQAHMHANTPLETSTGIKTETAKLDANTDPKFVRSPTILIQNHRPTHLPYARLGLWTAYHRHA